MAAKRQDSQQDGNGRMSPGGQSRTLDHADDLTGATTNAVHGAGGSSGSL